MAVIVGDATATLRAAALKYRSAALSFRWQGLRQFKLRKRFRTVTLRALAARRPPTTPLG